MYAQGAIYCDHCTHMIVPGQPHASRLIPGSEKNSGARYQHYHNGKGIFCLDAVHVEEYNRVIGPQLGR